MNNWCGSGRLVRDVDLRTGEHSSARFSLAVDRTIKRNDKWEHEADFISCVAFGQQAEFIEKYFKKGDFMIVSKGNIKTGSYTNKDGVKVYTTDVVVERAEFGGGKAKSEEQKPETSIAPDPNNDGFMNIPDGIDEELPFN